MTSEQLDQLSINTIRTLSIDAVQQAKSGHPGTPMALAPLVYTLWNRVMRFDPRGALGAAGFPTPDAAIWASRRSPGGADHTAPERVTLELLAALRALVPLAPLHLPAAGIDAVRVHFPALPQIACFDTAFHRRMPAVAQRLPLPRAFRAKGIQIDRERNARHDPIISARGSACTVRVVRTDEDLMIARHTRALFARSAA